jgi:hypothetical protein
VLDAGLIEDLDQLFSQRGTGRYADRLALRRRPGSLAIGDSAFGASESRDFG